MNLAPRFASIALVGVAAFALLSATTATAAPLTAPTGTYTEKAWAMCSAQMARPIRK
ncbi:MAG: hypothetical protein NTV96_08905 [Actinobacteria bacterium]|nr:hypothetical protein [Actinomycetota bacterium]